MKQSLKLLVIRQLNKSQMEVTGKQRMPNFPKKEHFLPPDAHTYVCVLEGKKCCFFGNFSVLCFYVISILRFAFLLYYPLNTPQILYPFTLSFRLHKKNIYLNQLPQQMGRPVALPCLKKVFLTSFEMWFNNIGT